MDTALKAVVSENELLKDEIRELKEGAHFQVENQELKAENQQLKEECQEVNEDYQELMEGYKDLKKEIKAWKGRAMMGQELMEDALKKFNENKEEWSSDGDITISKDVRDEGPSDARGQVTKRGRQEKLLRRWGWGKESSEEPQKKRSKRPYKPRHTDSPSNCMFCKKPSTRKGPPSQFCKVHIICNNNLCRDKLWLMQTLQIRNGQVVGCFFPTSSGPPPLPSSPCPVCTHNKLPNYKDMADRISRLFATKKRFKALRIEMKKEVSYDENPMSFSGEWLTLEGEGLKRTRGSFGKTSGCT